MRHVRSFISRDSFVKLSSRSKSLNPASALHFGVAELETVVDTAYTVRYKPQRLL